MMRTKLKIKKAAAAALAAVLLLSLCVFLGVAGTGKTVSADVETAEIDVYFLAGQSNAAGYTTNNRSLFLQLDERYVNGFDDVLYYGTADKSAFTTLSPVKSGMGSNERVGPELGMAYQLSASNEGKKAVIIKYAVGGSYLYDNATANVTANYGTWTPPSIITENGGKKHSNSGKLYSTFLSVAGSGLTALEAEGYTPVIKGMAWMQGCAESESAGQATAYAHHLTAFISDIRRDLGTIASRDLSRMPFAIGKICPLYNRNHVGTVRQQQEFVLGSVAMTTRVETNDFVLPGTDGAHFNTSDMLELGKRFASALMAAPGSNSVLVKSSAGGESLGGGITKTGETVTIVPKPEVGYELTSAVQKNSDSTTTDLLSAFSGGTYSFTMPAYDVVIELGFTALPTFKITVDCGAGGAVYRSLSTRDPYRDETVTFTVMPKDGYETAAVTLNGQTVTLDDKGTFSHTFTKDVLVKAEFKEKSAEQPGGGEQTGNTGKKGCGGIASGYAPFLFFSVLIACAFLMIIPKKRQRR